MSHLHQRSVLTVTQTECSGLTFTLLCVTHVHKLKWRSNMNINKKSALVSSFCGLMKSTVLINVTPAVKKREDRKNQREESGSGDGK